MRRPWVTAVLVITPLIVIALVAAGVVIWARSPPPITLTGTLTLQQAADHTCDQVYQGVQMGTDIQVQDQTGQIIALDHLGAPTATVEQQTTCMWPFRVAQIPRGRGFYVIVIGLHILGTYSEADIQQPLDLVLQ